MLIQKQFRITDKFKDEISQLKYEHVTEMKGIREQMDKMESIISRVFSDHLTGVESIDRKLMKQVYGYS